MVLGGFRSRIQILKTCQGCGVPMCRGGVSVPGAPGDPNPESNPVWEWGGRRDYAARAENHAKILRPSKWLLRRCKPGLRRCKRLRGKGGSSPGRSWGSSLDPDSAFRGSGVCPEDPKSFPVHLARPSTHLPQTLALENLLESVPVCSLLRSCPLCLVSCSQHFHNNGTTSVSVQTCHISVHASL